MLASFASVALAPSLIQDAVSRRYNEDTMRIQRVPGWKVTEAKN